MPKKLLTTQVLKMLYHFSKVKTKHKKVVCYCTGVMKEEDYLKCMEVVNNKLN